MFSEGRSPLKVTMCVWVSYVKCILTGWGGQEIVHVVWGGHCAPQKTVTLSNSYEIYVLSGVAWPPRRKNYVFSTVVELPREETSDVRFRMRIIYFLGVAGPPSEKMK